jgi:hypothetical protein
MYCQQHNLESVNGTNLRSREIAAHIRSNPPRYEFRECEVIEMRVSHFKYFRKTVVWMRREEKAMVREGKRRACFELIPNHIRPPLKLQSDDLRYSFVHHSMISTLTQRSTVDSDNCLHSVSSRCSCRSVVRVLA